MHAHADLCLTFLRARAEMQEAKMKVELVIFTH